MKSAYTNLKLVFFVILFIFSVIMPSSTRVLAEDDVRFQIINKIIRANKQNGADKNIYVNRKKEAVVYIPKTSADPQESTYLLDSKIKEGTFVQKNGSDFTYKGNPVAIYGSQHKRFKSGIQFEVTEKLPKVVVFLVKEGSNRYYVKDVKRILASARKTDSNHISLKKKENKKDFFRAKKLLSSARNLAIVANKISENLSNESNTARSNSEKLFDKYAQLSQKVGNLSSSFGILDEVTDLLTLLQITVEMTSELESGERQGLVNNLLESLRSAAVAGYNSSTGKNDNSFTGGDKDGADSPVSCANVTCGTGEICVIVLNRGKPHTECKKSSTCGGKICGPGRGCIDFGSHLACKKICTEGACPEGTECVENFGGDRISCYKACPTCANSLPECRDNPWLKCEDIEIYPSERCKTRPRCSCVHKKGVTGPCDRQCLPHQTCKYETGEGEYKNCYMSATCEDIKYKSCWSPRDKTKKMFIELCRDQCMGCEETKDGPVCTDYDPPKRMNPHTKLCEPICDNPEDKGCWGFNGGDSACCSQGMECGILDNNAICCEKQPEIQCQPNEIEKMVTIDGCRVKTCEKTSCQEGEVYCKGQENVGQGDVVCCKEGEECVNKFFKSQDYKKSIICCPSDKPKCEEGYELINKTHPRKPGCPEYECKPICWDKASNVYCPNRVVPGNDRALKDCCPSSKICQRGEGVEERNVCCFEPKKCDPIKEKEEILYDENNCKVVVCKPKENLCFDPTKKEYCGKDSEGKIICCERDGFQCDGLACVPKCNPGKVRDPQTGQCNCSEGEVDVCGECRKKCPENKEYPADCSSDSCQCKAGLDPVGDECKAPCKDDEIRNSSGVCVPKPCETACKPECTGGKSCSPTSDTDANGCVIYSCQCAPGEIIACGECRKACTGANAEYNDDCSDCECIEGFEKVGDECKEKCKPGQTRINGECVSCTTGCTAGCPSGTCNPTGEVDSNGCPSYRCETFEKVSYCAPKSTNTQEKYCYSSDDLRKAGYTDKHFANMTQCDPSTLNACAVPTATPTPEETSSPEEDPSATPVGQGRCADKSYTDCGGIVPLCCNPYQYCEKSPGQDKGVCREK